LLRKAVSLLMLVLLLLSSQPLVFAAKFSLGDTVEVINTGASGLVVRDAPAGNAIGKKYDGSRGMVLAGPQSASLGGVVYTWWKMRWGDDALEGWSAEGYPGGVDYLRKVSISPSTKFSIGDFVKVYNTGGSLIVRTDPPALSYKDSKVDGTFGKVEGGPFYGVAAGTPGFYYFWKVNYGSVVGWSAENWLMKATPSDLTVEDIWIDPASFNPGSTVTIYWRIKNIGASAATSDQGLLIKAYFDGALYHQEGIEGLGAGYAYTSQHSYTWPSDANSHTIRVEVDPSNYIIESNENNNIRSESFQASAPDLMVDDIWVDPDPPSPGGLTTWGIRIKNQGAGDATGTFFLECYFDNTYVGHVYVYGLSAGSTYTSYWQAMTWPSDTNPHTIKGVVDPDNKIIESNENNNVRSESFQATAPPQFDFTVGVSPSSGSVQQGGSVSATVTVTLVSGSTQTVSLTTSGLPSGASATFNPSSGYPTFTSTFTISTSSTTPTGTFYITIRGSGGGLTRTATYTLTVIPPVNQPPNKPTGASQYRSDGVTVIPEGGTTPESTVVFKATVSDPDGDSARLEIELRQIGEAFTGEPTAVSDIVPSGSQVAITRYGLVNADYHWRYRAKDINGAVSGWTEFGASGNVDFKVYAQADLSISIYWISNYSPREGQNITITVNVTNVGGRESLPSKIVFEQISEYREPVWRIWPFTISERTIDSIPAGGSRLFNFTWNAVEILNINPNKRLRFYVTPGDSNNSNNEVYVDADLNVQDQTAFDVSEHGFSFSNSEVDVKYEDLRKVYDALLADVGYHFKSLFYHFARLEEGVCHGMAATSIEYYKEGKKAFWMLENDVIQEIVDNQVFHQMLVKIETEIQKEWSLQEEYGKIDRNLKNQPLIMWIYFRGGSVHAVTIFDVYSVTSDVKNIIVYDPNYPGMGVVITFDLKNGIVTVPLYMQNEFGVVERIFVYESWGLKIDYLKTRIIEYLRTLGKRILDLKCPVNVTITDEYGRVISEVENQIPGASFEYYNLTGIKIFYLPLNLTYKVQLSATDYGNLTISQIAPTESLYETALSVAMFNLTKATKAQFDLLPFNATYTLKIDENGDGKIDYELIPEVKTLITEYDVGIVEIIPSETIVVQGYNLPINVTIMNYGAYTETFNVTIYANETLIAAQTITLANGTFTTYTFTWNTAGFALGNYTISVYAAPLPGETVTDDNEIVDGVVQILPSSIFYTFSIVWGEETFVVSVESNSTVSNFAFNQPSKEISFNVTGSDGTVGFCNVTIPKALLYAELGEWNVLIDGAPVPPTITENATHSCLYFTYTHSTHLIQIIGTWVVSPPDTTPPLIKTPFQQPEPDKVTPDQAVKVYVNVTDTESGVKNVILSYTTNGGATWNNLTMLYNATAGLYQATIPAFPSGTTICYKIIAYDNADNVAINDNAGQYYCYTVNPPAPPSLLVSISPLSASILVGQSITFTSTVSGGYTPCSYQWYLNGNPVSGATSNTWTFTPTTSGIYYVHLKVTDDKGNTAQSDSARITVATVPVGGYSIPIQLPTTAKPATIHIALLTILTALFITIKRKTKRKH